MALQDHAGASKFHSGAADAMRGADPDYAQRDLFDAIQKGDFPKWRVSVQIMPEKEAGIFYLNPFDLTKVWPHKDYPLIEVGELVLDRNPENYFAEVEQAAFGPKNIVPGMGYSPDKMLQARLISYPDAHRYRLESIMMRCRSTVRNVQCTRITVTGNALRR